MLSMFFLGMFAGVILAVAIAFYSVLFGLVKFDRRRGRKGLRRFLRTGEITWKEAGDVYYRWHV